MGKCARQRMTIVIAAAAAAVCGSFAQARNVPCGRVAQTSAGPTVGYAGEIQTADTPGLCEACPECLANAASEFVCAASCAPKHAVAELLVGRETVLCRRHSGRDRRGRVSPTSDAGPSGPIATVGAGNPGFALAAMARYDEVVASITGARIRGISERIGWSTPSGTFPLSTVGGEGQAGSQAESPPRSPAVYLELSALGGVMGLGYFRRRALLRW